MPDPPALRCRELSASPEDRVLLHAFYQSLCVPEFPDPDERESLANMERYLELKASGWYGANNYHILLFFDDTGAFLAGSVSDYLADPNAGVLEFMVVDPRWRHRGIGQQVLEQTERTLLADARHASRDPLACIVGELNDPCKPATETDSIDPFLRLEIWQRWGYGRLDFPYVQPALSPNQRPVRCLLLAAKTFPPESRHLPPETVKRILHEYMRLAMRITTPEDCPEFEEMSRALDAMPMVALGPLARVLKAEEKRPIEVHEIAGADDRDFNTLLAIYAAAFGSAPTAISLETLRDAVRQRAHSDGAYAWHLWAIRSTAGRDVDGMASFFTFPGFGFGGYIAFDPSARGRGYLQPVLARIEEQMVRDCRGARGWYIECESDRVAEIFRKRGFREVPITYRQPPLRGGEAPALKLLYKEIGNPDGPVVTCAELLSALEWIFGGVYKLDAPRQSPYFADIERAIGCSPTEVIKWRW